MDKKLESIELDATPELCFRCHRPITDMEKRVEWHGAVFCSEVCQHLQEFKTW